MEPKIMVYLAHSPLLGSLLAHAGHHATASGLPWPLLTETHPSLGAILLGLAVAWGWGALHALSPGHGKTLVSAYLIGNQGTAAQAVLLGVTTTVAHTFSVFILGLIALFAAQYVLPEQLYPVLSLVSGLLVCGVGLSLLQQRLTDADPDHSGHGHHSHSHSHSHGHGDHSHSHEHPHTDLANASHDHPHPPHGEHTHFGHTHPTPGQPVTLKSLVMLGIAGGITPCPSALVMLLGAIALHQTVYGLLLVAGFSLGLATVLIALGLMAVYARDWLNQVPMVGQIMQRLPVASAATVVVIGLGLTLFAVMPSLAAWV